MVAPADLIVCEPMARLLEDRFPNAYTRRRKETAAMHEADLAVVSHGAMRAPEAAELGILMLEAVLPRQRFQLNVIDRRHCALVRAALEGGGKFGMIGSASRGCGVEVLIEESTPQLDGCFLLQVLGVRAFRIDETCEHPDSGYSMAKVHFIQVDEDECRAEDVRAAQALQPLIAEWEDLVRAAWPQHLASILHDLGPLPPAEHPGDRALWVAALVNPIPPLGIAPEIRPEVLAAAEVQDRLLIVRSGVELSLTYLRSTARSPLRRCHRLLAAVPPHVTAIIVVLTACTVSAVGFRNPFSKSAEL